MRFSPRFTKYDDSAGKLDENGGSMDKFALLLMDFQNAVCKGMAAAEVEKRGTLKKARAVLEAARKHKVPVIHVRVGFDPKHSVRTSKSKRFEQFDQSGAMRIGSPDTEFCDEVKPIDGEPVVLKGCVNPFIGTALTELLIGRRVGEVYLAGVVTNMVVESALRHAADSGFACNVLEDCCAAVDPSMHDFAIQKIFPVYGAIVSSNDFITRAASQS
ncbi:MAG: cysteine hydrolase family protein [Vulcanimicrobiaceae bacterium]